LLVFPVTWVEEGRRVRQMAEDKRTMRTP
jgi:hypothetical protein